MDGVAQLVAAKACENLVYEFVHRVDTGARAAIADLFTADGSWQAGPEPVVGTEALVAYFTRADATGPLTRHVVTNVSITLDSEDRARGRALVLWFRFERPGPDLAADVVEDAGPYRIYLGEYHDRFVRAEDGWRFEARVRKYVHLSQERIETR